MIKEKSLEHKARRAAKQAGLVACKGRSRSSHVNDHGFSMLVDLSTNTIVAGERFDVTEMQVIGYCREDSDRSRSIRKDARGLTKQAAYHEAGHSVARIYVGAVATPVEIQPDGTGTSYGTRELWESGGVGQYAAWDYLIVTLAGVMSEARVSHRPQCVTWMLHGREDQIAADETIAWLVSRGYADSVDFAWLRATGETRCFLREHWTTIGVVAEELLGRGRLEAHEVQALVDQVRESGQAGSLMYTRPAPVAG